VSFVKHTLLADDAIATPLVLGNASRLLAAITLSTFPNTAASGPMPHDRSDAKPAIPRRTMDNMDVNAANDIGLVEIAEAVHVTPRAAHPHSTLRG
jgi:hypothetical protein